MIQEYPFTPKASARQKDPYPAQLFSLGSVSSLVGSSGRLVGVVGVGCERQSEGRLRCTLKVRCYDTNKPLNNAVPEAHEEGPSLNGIGGTRGKSVHRLRLVAKSWQIATN